MLDRGRLDRRKAPPAPCRRLLPRGRQVDFTQLSSPSRWKPEFAVPFNQRMIGQKVLITNDFGDWLLLTQDEFRDFVEGRPQPGEPLYDKLKARQLRRRRGRPRRRRPTRWRRKKQYLFYGPTLHAFVLTHRCNHGCQYCHSSIVGMERTDTDMSIEVAERAVDIAFQTTARAHDDRVPGRRADRQLGRAAARRRVRARRRTSRPRRCCRSRWSPTCR